MIQPPSISTLVERLIQLYARLGCAGKNYDGEAIAETIDALASLQSRIEEVEGLLELCRKEFRRAHDGVDFGRETRAKALLDNIAALTSENKANG